MFRKRIQVWNRKLKLRERLFYTFTLFTLLALIIVSILFYLRFSREFAENTEEMIIKSMEQTSNYISFRLESLKDVSSQAYLDNEFKELIKDFKKEQNGSEKFIKYSYLLNKTRSLSLGKDVSGVRLYIDDGFISEASNSFIFREEAIREENWYEHVIEEDGTIVWIPTYEFHFSFPYRNENVISLARVIKDNEFASSKLAVFVVDIHESVLREILSKVSITKKGEVHLVNQSGYVLTSTNDELALSFVDLSDYVDIQNRYSHGVKDIKINSKNKKVFHNRIPNSDWQLISVIPYEEIREGGRSILSFMGLVFLIVVSISLYFAVKISRNLTYRIESLSEKMDLVKEDNWDISFVQDYEDELGELEENFKYMTEQIQSLIQEQKEAAFALRNAELRTLQAQINPHFLYNILDLINWLSIKHEAHDINEIVEKLAKFFRISLSSGREFVKLREELEHIQLYVDIQNKRFEDRIKLEVYVDDNLLDYYTINLILQPLIENAIIHGISEKEDPNGKIVVTGYQDLESIVIEIMDDGVGIPDYRIKEIMSFKDTDSYGVKNVHERLSLRFGDMYGLTFESKPGKGTKVSVKIPIINDIDEIE